MGPGSAVVDRSGRLWVINAHAGALKWFDATSGSRTGVHAGAQLVLAGGVPVLVHNGVAE